MSGLGLETQAQAAGRAGQASQLSLAQKSTLLLWGVNRSERKHLERLFLTWHCAVASDKLAGPVMTLLPCLQSMWQWSYLVFIASLASCLLPFLQQLDSSGSFPFWRREGSETAPVHFPLFAGAGSHPLLPSPPAPPSGTVPDSLGTAACSPSSVFWHCWKVL